MLQFVTIISGFIIPRIILTNFGSEVNGLVSSLNQFLNYVYLFEGGLGGAVLANLYKPLYKDPNMATGLPVYIIVKDNKQKYVRGVAGREIQKYRVQQKNMLKSNSKD